MTDAITVHELSDGQEFLKIVGDWLSTDCVGTNVVATVASGRAGRISDSHEDRFWYATTGTEVTGVCLWTPPRGVLLPRLSAPVAAAFATYLAEHYRQIPGINGPLATGATFLDRWRSITGEIAEPALRTRMFRLGALNSPAGVPGRLRRATVDDEEQVVAWTLAFSEEALTEHRGRAEVSAAFRRQLAAGTVCWLWEVDGRAVSMLYESEPMSGVVRIQVVYTPPVERRKGYAGACVAAAATSVLSRDGITECVLFADRANQTSTELYRRLGFEEIIESVNFEFVR